MLGDAAPLNGIDGGRAREKKLVGTNLCNFFVIDRARYEASKEARKSIFDGGPQIVGNRDILRLLL